MLWELACLNYLGSNFMKKIVIIGGSNGLGLALSKAFIQKGYFVHICDIVEPEENCLPPDGYDYNYLNMLDFDEQLLNSFATDESIVGLFITAGVGRIANFEYHHLSEIEKFFTINSVSTIKALSIFFSRIKSNSSFYCGVVGSIAGWLSSPAATVYSASKASIVRFIESVNIELEVDGFLNRILDVSPASFKGSKFYGGKNNIDLLKSLADSILDCLFKKETLYIPQYKEVFKDVLNSYKSNPHAYGIHSYNYKKESGRIDNSKRVCVGYLSGTFDLFHVGHLNLLKRAKQQCDYLIVGVHNSGKWKGKETFISLEDRKAIVASCKYVDKVVDSCIEDSDAWDLWHYDKLFVGSDYKGTERFQKYEEYFKNKGVTIVYFPYTKSISSTLIRNKIKNEAE